MFRFAHHATLAAADERKSIDQQVDSLFARWKQS
jgi:hypothetical protein